MPPTVKKIFQDLGGAATFGCELRSELDIALAVNQGLPLTALHALTLSGFNEREIASFVIKPHTLARRSAQGCSLTPAESDLVMRLLRIQRLAIDTFGDRRKAMSWLRRPLAALQDQTPLTLLRTEAGARIVETMISKIAWGSAA